MNRKGHEPKRVQPYASWLALLGGSEKHRIRTPGSVVPMATQRPLPQLRLLLTSASLAVLCSLAPIGVSAQTDTTNAPFSYQLSEDGHLLKLDGLSGAVAAETATVGTPDRVQLSEDGKWLAMTTRQPAALTIYATSDLSVAHQLRLEDKRGQPVAGAVLSLSTSRDSFVLALSDRPELWEVFYGPNPPQFGFAHDWRIEGPVDQPTAFPVRKITLRAALIDLILDPSGEYVLGDTGNGSICVTDLVIGQQVAQHDLPNGTLVTGLRLSASEDGVLVTLSGPGPAGLLFSTKDLSKPQLLTHRDLLTLEAR